MDYNTVVPLLRRMFKERGDSVALVGTKDKSLTYDKLGSRVRALSKHLRRNVGVMSGHAVGVCMDRSFDHIVTILGILDAGAAYVPLDPNLPHQQSTPNKHKKADACQPGTISSSTSPCHLAPICLTKDAQLHIILTQRKYSLDLENVLHQQGSSSELIYVDGLVRHLVIVNAESDEDLTDETFVEPDPEDLANVIYTSGSAGEPKGVMVLHKGVLALSQVAAEVWELRKSDSCRVLQFSSHCFDASTVEIFATLCSGATLVLGSRDELLPGQKLADFIHTHGVSVTLLPPSVLATLNEFSSSLPSLRTIIAGGEACTLALARKWSSPQRRFINAYGPTECTVISTMHVFDASSNVIDLKTVPLGDPLPGWQVHLLDDKLEPVDDGEVGEIFISGVGVSRGYLGKPELTSKYFRAHPQTGVILYSSGDLGIRRGSTRLLLEFVGRVDNQIKISGFRVELGAVEQTLCEHPAVEHAAVKAVEANNDGSNLMLVAYVVLRQKAAESELFSSSVLKSFLLDHLPSYMVPPVYVSMDALPLTANGGKVDRKALPHPFSLTSSISCTESDCSPGVHACSGGEDPDNELNVMISQCCEVFGKVLVLDAGVVKTDSNFFHLGGNSLWVARLVSELGQTFNLEFLAWQIYKHPTPQQLVSLILEKRNESKLQDGDNDELYEEAHSLDATLRPIQSGGSVARPPSSVALVTGATGFLGVFLLENLLAQGPYRKIYCLVRAKSVAHAWERLQGTREKYGVQTRISSVELVMVVGDVQEPNMGLSRDSYSELCEDVDTIYHVAAVTNYIKPYTEMRLPNVEGTRNVLHFAATGPCLKTLHYVSTIGIYGSLSAFSCDRLDENLDMERCLSFMSTHETGYTKSKWVAEIMVLDFKARGFRVSIYRPGFIEAHSVTGIANTDDMMCRYIQGCIQMGSYPTLPKKYWEPISVNFAADAISYISSTRAPGEIYNLVPDREREIGNAAIFQSLIEDGQCMVEKLPISDWLDALSRVPSSNPLYPLVAYLSQRDHGNSFTPLEMPTGRFDFKNTLEGLRGSDIEVPSFDKSLLKKYVHFLQH